MVSREKHTLRIVLIISIALFIIILSFLVWLILSSSTKEVTYDDPKVAHRVVRGTIYDRNGEILAIETPYYALAFHLWNIKDRNSLITTISPLIHMSESEIQSLLKGKLRYALIKKNLSTSEKSILEKMIIQGKLPGAIVEKRYGRVYPQNYHASQIIGFTNSENVGLEGLEYSYNSTLLPYPHLNEDITFGDDVHLTLDMNIQYMLDFNIRDMVKEHNAESAVGLVIEAKTGAIIASTSYPWYDPENYASSSPESRRNSFATQMREPGSVFKIFSLAAELDSQSISEDAHFYCDGQYTYIGEDGNKITINCVGPHGDVDINTMIAKSCNGAVAHWSHAMEKETFFHYLEKFGFTTLYDIPLSGVTRGYLAQTDSWSSRSKATISFGQEIAVTPLQIVVAATAIANKGNRVTPYLVSLVTHPDGSIVFQRDKEQIYHPVIDESVALTVLGGMKKATIANGTATKTSVLGVEVGSKTGTAQVANPDGGGYLAATYLASTLSIFPLDDPEYIIYVAALDPKGTTIWGSSIASPAIGNMISDMVRTGYVTSSAIETVEVDN